MRLMRDIVGETLSNRYRMIARVAGGGMGEVYRGHDLLLDRTVAVKVLQRDLAGDPELVSRFKAEARAAARLTHPNVVAVYDWGAEDEHTYYMVMEYVPGTDLRDVLVTKGSVGLEQAVEIVAGVCDALAAAHAGGLVHRDVKPENVLIARSGTVKVADFGIAAVADAERTSPGGSIPGTLRYLSPEQAAGREATIASDIWAAGALLSELLTGMPPLQGAGQDLIRRRATEAPLAPSTFGHKVPERVDRIVLRACAVDPSARFESASEMSAELRRTAGDLKTAAPLNELLEEVTGEIRLPDMHPTDFAPRGASKMRRRKGRMFALAFLVALIALGGARGVAALLAPQEVAVPDLVGMRHERAAELAEGTGVTVEIIRRANDFSTEEGQVLAQEPADGVMTEGEVIELVVSKGPPPVGVPSITGMTLDVATVRLHARQLEVGEVMHRHDVAEQGTVIGQKPSSGRLEWGTKVDLVVSKGPLSVPVPDVTKMTVREARATLTEAGFKVEVTDAYSNDIPPGKVVGTVPGAGTEAPEGSTIEIQKSIGPEFKELVMPDVRNMTLDAARSKLVGMGLRVFVNYVGDSCTNGMVADTDPLPREKIHENDRVALFVVC
jgi:eukaryotic-like serine/threonine-protein kinase